MSFVIQEQGRKRKQDQSCSTRFANENEWWKSKDWRGQIWNRGNGGRMKVA